MGQKHCRNKNTSNHKKTYAIGQYLFDFCTHFQVNSAFCNICLQKTNTSFEYGRLSFYRRDIDNPRDVYVTMGWYTHTAVVSTADKNINDVFGLLEQNDYIVHYIELYKIISYGHIALYSGIIFITSFGDCVRCDFTGKGQDWKVSKICTIFPRKKLTDGFIDILKLINHCTEFPTDLYTNTVQEYNTILENKIKVHFVSNI